MKTLKVEKAYIKSQNELFDINAEWSIEYAYTSLLNGISSILVINGVEYTLETFRTVFINNKTVNKKVNKKDKKLSINQLKRVKFFIKCLTKQAIKCEADGVVKALKIDLQYCHNWSIKEAITILTDTKNYLLNKYIDINNTQERYTQNYILNTVIKGLNSYSYINIRSYKGSQTKHKIIIKTFSIKENQLKKTRKEFLEIANKWIIENNINDDTISFELI